MRELCHLQLIGNKLTNNGLQAILDSCRHLESLDLRICFNVDLDGDLGKRCIKQIKKLRLPKDSTADFEFIAEISTHGLYGSNSDDEGSLLGWSDFDEDDEISDASDYFERSVGPIRIYGPSGELIEEIDVSNKVPHGGGYGSNSDLYPTDEGDEFLYDRDD